MKDIQWRSLEERHKLATASPVKKKAVKKSASKTVKKVETVVIPDVPVRKASPKPKSVRPKPVTIAEKITEIPAQQVAIKNLDEKKLAGLLALIIFMTAFITYGVTHKIDSATNASSAASATSFIAKISGGVALTEPELRDVVRQLKRTVFWTGPQKNARYTINALTDGQTYLRYLPDGKGVSDTQPNYRTVGTYESQDAYTATLAAGNEANGVSFTTTDGRVIHYNKASEGNIYMAFKGKPFQIEIFDPNSGAALDIANSNKLEIIK